MSTGESKINIIETIPENLRNMLKDALQEAMEGSIKDLENFNLAIKQLFLAIRKEAGKLREIIRTIDLNSTMLRNLNELFKGSPFIT